MTLVMVESAKMVMIRYSEVGGASSTRILDDVCSCMCLIMDPDLPMMPPMRDAWHKRRKHVRMGDGG